MRHGTKLFLTDRDFFLLRHWAVNGESDPLVRHWGRHWATHSLRIPPTPLSYVAFPVTTFAAISVLSLTADYPTDRH
jgi:hypothetical protein